MRIRHFECIAVFLFAFLLVSIPARSQEPATSHPSSMAEAPKYPNTKAGLQQFLNAINEAAKANDSRKLTGLIKATEVPKCDAWLHSMYASDKADSWMSLCDARILNTNEQSLIMRFTGFGKADGEFVVRKVNDDPEPGRGLEWGWLQAIRQHLDIYFAGWKSAESTTIEPVGYFMFVEGGFRWNSTLQVLMVIPTSTTGVQSFAAVPAEPEGQSASGTVYVSERYKLKLTVPQGWRTNDSIARAQFGIGAFSSPDENVNLLIQQMPGERDPTDFVKKLDARGDRLFASYRKISESQMLIDGKNCETIEFQFTDTRQTSDGLSGLVHLQSWMVFIPVQKALLLFNFVGSSSDFDTEQPRLNKIAMSYHSTVE